MEQKIANINGVSYIINPFKGRKGFQLLGRLTKHATPIIAGMQDSENVDISSIVRNLFAEGTEDFVNLCFDLITDVQKDGMQINVDLEFRQNYFAILELALEVIKLNYNDVFQKLGINFESQ